MLEAVKALKEDVMRSVSARLDIHADTLVGEDGVPKWNEQTNVSVVQNKEISTINNLFCSYPLIVP